MSSPNEYGLTLRQLRAFDATAAEGSFTRAAQRLHVTQSALSLLIRELERQLDASLFDRTTRQVELTAAGREFQPRVRRLLNELGEAAAAVADIRDKRKGVLRLAAPQLIASTVVPAVLGLFVERFPGVELRLQDCPADMLLERVSSAEAELAIGPDTGHELPELERHPVVSDRHWLVCRTGDFPAGRKSVRWNQLAGLRFVAPTRDFVARMTDAVGAACDPLLEQPRREVSYFTTAFGLVAAGLGVTLCPTYAREIVKAYGLRMVALDGPIFSREVCIWSRRNNQWSAAATGFVQTLHEVVGASKLFDASGASTGRSNPRPVARRQRVT